MYNFIEAKWLSNRRNDKDVCAIFSSFPEEFRNTEYPEFIDNMWFTLSGTDNPSDESYFYSVDAKEPDRLYKTPVSIWLNKDAFDYWSRINYIRKNNVLRVIISDYSGIRVFDEKLNIIFSLPISSEMIETNDVYGYHYDNVNILIWKMSDTFEDEYGNRADYNQFSQVSKITTIMSPF